MADRQPRSGESLIAKGVSPWYVVQPRSAQAPTGRQPPCANARGAGLCLAVALCATVAAAQEPAKRLPPKQDVSLATKDDVVLKATFWPGTRDKESVPVILLHGFGGSRQDMQGLAEYLQAEKGCAVIAPDLRGHGDSKSVRNSNRKLEAAKMLPLQFQAMGEDVEAAKKFLMEKNNAGALNIDKLCLVGAEMGALVAANWTIVDWSWPDLAVGKQGRDVKALVLISPPERFKTLRMLEPLNHPAVRARVAMCIIVGEGDPAALKDATKTYAALLRFHPESDKDKLEDRDLFSYTINTSLQGAKLLAKEFGLREKIGEFIELRADKQPYVWKDRKLP